VIHGNKKLKRETGGGGGRVSSYWPERDSRNQRLKATQFNRWCVSGREGSGNANIWREFLKREGKRHRRDLAIRSEWVEKRGSSGIELPLERRRQEFPGEKEGVKEEKHLRNSTERTIIHQRKVSRLSNQW